MVLVDPPRLRWFVAGITAGGPVVPLLRSDDGNLSPYVSLAFDEQLSFLRHRLCGVLQRGSDRLYQRDMKARQIVVLLSDLLEAAAPGSNGLTPRLAEHLVEWLTSPPIAFFLIERRADDQTELTPLAGTIDAEWSSALRLNLAEVLAMTKEPERWELAKWKSSA